MHDALGHWTIRDGADGDPFPAVDHDIYRSLIAAGRLADPYVARGEAAAEWVRTRDWWWHAPLDLAASDGGMVELVFDGLDTFADVYLDGDLLGRTDNMFRQWRFDLSGIAAGRHDLALRFHPTATMLGNAPLPLWSAFTDRITASRRTLVRKAQFGWGWDWGPDLPTTGVWQPARIERRRHAVVESLNVTTLALADDRADLRVDIDLSDDDDVDIELIDPAGASIASASRHGSGPIDLTIAQPQLWWTADLGDQPLYTLRATTEGGTVERRIGIRTIALDQSPDPDEPGTTFFRFLVNGVPIFAKGACWVPASSFVGAIPDATYRDLLERAADANMNMVRIWGGGIYEPDIFYDECDRLGLLVWQDFMFACAPYPDDSAFLANVRGEVIDQVRRLRHHASIALWCGNNENQAIQFFEDSATGTTTPLAGQVIYDDLIPSVLADLDPATPYWPGSPFGGPTPNSMRGGDVHNWTVWHGIPLVPDAAAEGGFDTSPEGVAFTRYAEDKARFVSEFGIQAAPDIATLRRWMAPEDMTLGTQGFLDRIKDVADKASAMMLPFTGLPATLDDYVDFTQATQAEGLKFGIEHYRRRTPHCSGALIWQHNDCWPCVSWSLVDYDGVAKASWYATRRAFAPVMASFRREGDAVELWVVNDTRERIADEAAIALELLAGGEAWRHRIAFDLAPLSSACVWRGTAADATDRLLTVRGTHFPANRALLAPVKDLALAKASLTVKKEAGGIAVTAARYALDVRLRVDDPALRFDDNHFDLAAGESRTVAVTHRDGGGISLDAVEVTCWQQRRRT